MEIQKINIGIIGSGAISEIYLDNLTSRFSNVQVSAISSRGMASAQKKAEKYHIRALTNDQMLADPDIDIIVILTPVQTHYELIKSALLAGKHVYTEKTMTETYAEAKELCESADAKGLYLGSAPDTFLGTGFQTAKKAIDENKIGTIHSFTISITRDNDILTAMFPFLRIPGAGALRDYIVYYLTALVSLLGPVKTVSAVLKTPYDKRMNSIPDTKGFNEMIDTPNEAIIAATLELENGVIGTIHEDNESVIFDRSDFVICGKNGLLKLGNANEFGNPVELIRPKGFFEKETEVLKPVGFYSDNSRGIGPAELADAIVHHRKNRTDKAMAAHVLEVIEAMEQSSKEGRFIEVESTFEKPELFDMKY